MSTEQRLTKVESDIARILVVVGEASEILGLTVESQRRIAERAAHTEATLGQTNETLKEVTDKLNVLISGSSEKFVGGFGLGQLAK